MSARNVSHGTSRSIASSGSPFADKASKRLSASKNPSCPIVASANQNLTHQIRTGRENQLFFEVRCNLSNLQLRDLRSKAHGPDKSAPTFVPAQDRIAPDIPNIHL